MCCGAIKRKTQRFNSKSAGVTSTMLLFAVIGAFGPTLFYQIYGTHELTCQDCINFDRPSHGGAGGALRDCRRCYFSQTPSFNDRFYLEAVRPYCYLAAGMLFLSYIIGLWFTLRTHAAVIWNSDMDEKKHDDQITPHSSARPSGNPLMGDATSVGIDVRDTHLYKRILGQSLRQVGHNPRPDEQLRQDSTFMGGANGTPHVVPPKTGFAGDTMATTNLSIPGFSEAQNNNLVHQVAEIAATAAVVAARNVSGPRRSSANAVPTVPAMPAHQSISSSRHVPIRTGTFPDHEYMGEQPVAHAGGHGGHDAPNWSRLKSSIILMGATVLYAIIAEILVDTVDVVLENFEIDEKFLGITLFALVPNTTEFLVSD